MDRRYWDQLAERYDEQIFSSFEADRTGILSRCLDHFADPRKTAMDLGCGVGKYLPALARRFEKVVGVDLSPRLLEVDAEAAESLNNVKLVCADATEARRLTGQRVDVIVCANVLIMADDLKRHAILETARKSLVRGGHLILVVPSMESALLTHRRLIEWNRRDGEQDPEAAAETEGIVPSKRTCRELLRGHVRIENVPTKHHLAEELDLSLKQAGLRPLRLEKVLYGWDSEFSQPPRWMRDPYPWDWLAVATKPK